MYFGLLRGLYSYEAPGLGLRVRAPSSRGSCSCGVCVGSCRSANKPRMSIPFLGVLKIRSLLDGVHIRASSCWLCILSNPTGDLETLLASLFGPYEEI